MLRGFRWQFIALIAATTLFVVSLVLRQENTSPSPSPTPQPTLNAEGETTLTQPTQAPLVELPPDTNLIENPNVVANPIPADNVPTFHEGLIGNVQRLNPLFASLNPVDRDITSLIFEGLTKINEYGEPRPSLAERWVISSDALEYTFFLRQDVLWQDGIPFTAADVMYTASILRDPNFAGETDLGEFWRTVETQQLDTHVVRFRLTQPQSTFLDKVSIGILPDHALSGTSARALINHPFNASPIGTGAYQLEALRTISGTRIDAVDLRVSPNYRQRPQENPQAYAIDRMSFILFETFDSALEALKEGQIDGLAGRDRRDRQPLFFTANDEDLTTSLSLEPTLGVFIFNWVNDDARFFREQRVRTALETGLDRAAMIDRALGYAGVMADSPILPGSWAYVPNLPYPAYNPEQARQLLVAAAERLARLEAAQQSDDATEESEATEEATSPYIFSFAILVPQEDVAIVTLANEMASQWSQLGLGVTVDAVDTETYQTRLENHQFDTALVEYSMVGSADPDVFSFWHQGEYPDGENYGGADDRSISELLERARRDPFGINRVALYRDFQRQFVERAIAIPMYYPVYTYVTSPRLNGLQLSFIGTSADRFRNIGDWSLSN